MAGSCENVRIIDLQVRLEEFELPEIQDDEILAQA